MASRHASREESSRRQQPTTPRHIRSDSWRNAFYHPPSSTMYNSSSNSKNDSGRQEHPHHEQHPSMADVAELAVSLEGIDVSEVGVVPSSRRSRRRRRRQQDVRPRAPLSVSPPSPSTNARGSANQPEPSMYAASDVYPIITYPATASAAVDHRELINPSFDPPTAAQQQHDPQQYPFQQQQYYGSNHNVIAQYGSLGAQQQQHDRDNNPNYFYNQHNNPPPPMPTQRQQWQDIQAFSAMATQDRAAAMNYPSSSTNGNYYSQQPPPPHPLLTSNGAADSDVAMAKTTTTTRQDKEQQKHGRQESVARLRAAASSKRYNDMRPDDKDLNRASPRQHKASSSSACCCGCWFDMNGWLIRDAQVGDDGLLYCDTNWSLPALVRHYFFNPLQPEFTSLQQFNWAVVIGIVMGIYTAAWKYLIKLSVEFVWVTVPAFLLKHGIVSGIDGCFPLYHYMWITPALFGGVLSYLLFVLPRLPDQNDWITNVHRHGVMQSYKTFWSLFFISTASLASGLSLGPELPLILTASMFGSWLASACKQSMLQARILNLTAAGAAIGGFFGFPMAGALFVLEVPHRMGLQYFEALSPATISSIVAVLCNGLLTKNPVTGYYKYPFLSATLPSDIFASAIFYGFYGALVGTIYVFMVKRCKGFVYKLFPLRKKIEQVVPAADCRIDLDLDDELIPLVRRGSESRSDTKNWLQLFQYSGMKCDAMRVALVGAFAGALVGWIGVFLPHVMFWGEAQLQSLIDKGRTPLPIFGSVNQPTRGLTARGYCMVDAGDEKAIREGLDLSCTFMISVAKMVVTGLSLGIGIGGQFWGPLFVGCSAGHFLVHLLQYLVDVVGIPAELAARPCVVILCTMGASHVVTFRAHLAIMLILTLTISTFDSETDPSASTAGDYSAVFPLLVVSVFVSLMTTRATVFYASQRSRGDITAVPEVLCEPGMAGRPLVFEYDGDSCESSDAYTSDDDDMSSNKIVSAESASSTVDKLHALQQPTDKIESFSVAKEETSVPAPFDPILNGASDSAVAERHSIERLDELLSKPMNSVTIVADSIPLSPHRYTSVGSPIIGRTRSNSTSSTRGAHVRITSFGELEEHRPSLLDQARIRAATADLLETHRRVGSHGSSSRGENFYRQPNQSSAPRHRRKDSESSITSYSGVPLPSSRHVRKDSYDAGAHLNGTSPIVAPVAASALNMQDIDDAFRVRVDHMANGGVEPK